MTLHRGEATRSSGREGVIQAPIDTSIDSTDKRAEPERPLAALFVHRTIRSQREDGVVPTVAPDVIGMEMPDAYAFARHCGLRVAVSIWETKTGPWGLVLSQRPEAGSRVRRGARIHVVVAGQPHVSMPDVRGLDVDVAALVLREVSLRAAAIVEVASRSIPLGHVVSTRPSAGALVVVGSEVSLRISKSPRVNAHPDSHRLPGFPSDSA